MSSFCDSLGLFRAIFFAMMVLISFNLYSKHLLIVPENSKQWPTHPAVIFLKCYDNLNLSISANSECTEHSKEPASPPLNEKYLIVERDSPWLYKSPRVLVAQPSIYPLYPEQWLSNLLHRNHRFFGLPLDRFPFGWYSNDCPPSFHLFS